MSCPIYRACIHKVTGTCNKYCGDCSVLSYTTRKYDYLRLQIDKVQLLFTLPCFGPYKFEFYDCEWKINFCRKP